MCISACGCVRVFVDARELGKSRVRTNHSVAGIHYYRGEHVPKSTLRSPSFSPDSLRFTSESSGTFFVFFFPQSWTDLGIFYGPFTVRAEQRKAMKKSRGCSHTHGQRFISLCSTSRSGKMYDPNHSFYLIIPTSATPNQPRCA